MLIGRQGPRKSAFVSSMDTYVCMSQIGKLEGFECLKTCRPQKTSPPTQQRETARQTADATLFTIRREGRGGGKERLLETALERNNPRVARKTIRLPQLTGAAEAKSNRNEKMLIHRRVSRLCCIQEK